MASETPIEDTMRAKVGLVLYAPEIFKLLTTQITEAFKPTTLEIYNDSELHSHHHAMAGNSSKETHFRVVITSDAFESKRQPARHRMVYTLLKEEMAKEGGIHALQLRTKTPEEEETLEEREAKEKGEPAGSASVEAA
ncbi:hypothetical protein B7494_g502 [Chlorociboria aeruginascens]|nr:hypothetical protein B7494_g502 [Chlorociboria aeruginascens]